MSQRLLSVLLLVLATRCTAGRLPDGVALMPSNDHRWQCTGIPPTPRVEGGWKVQPLSMPRGTPEPEVRRQAAEELVKKLCGTSNDSACRLLLAKVINGELGESSTETCAVALIRAGDYEAWKKHLLSDAWLREQFQEMAAMLLSQAPVGGGSLVVADIREAGLPGGERAEWISRHIRQGLVNRGIPVEAPPKGWVPDEVPEGARLLVRGRIYELQAGDFALVDVSLEAFCRFEGRTRLCGAHSLRMPAAVAPAPRRRIVEKDSGVSDVRLSVDARPGGGLCRGQPFNLWLKADKPKHVRVINLAGGEGAVLFPNAAHPSGLLVTGERIALGGQEGFLSIGKSEFEEEVYVVLTSETEEGLGSYQKLNGFCKLRPHTVSILERDGFEPPGTTAFRSGYRVVSAKDCPEITEPLPVTIDWEECPDVP